MHPGVKKRGLASLPGWQACLRVATCASRVLTGATQNRRPQFEPWRRARHVDLLRIETTALDFTDRCTQVANWLRNQIKKCGGRRLGNARLISPSIAKLHPIHDPDASSTQCSMLACTAYVSQVHVHAQVCCSGRRSDIYGAGLSPPDREDPSSRGR